ncbi:hypothetical protein [Sphingomonas crocodyli]|uniref:hypothetical protein n=1 Tax=Sphingomonas crocodyli TaxID=1979270 RepID=UPI001F0C2E52|nr:hypothetical protein [Sphingomonas crocodyli]
MQTNAGQRDLLSRRLCHKMAHLPVLIWNDGVVAVRAMPLTLAAARSKIRRVWRMTTFGLAASLPRFRSAGGATTIVPILARVDHVRT